MESSKFNKDLAQEIITKLEEASELIEKASQDTDWSDVITLSLDEFEDLVAIQCVYMNCKANIEVLRDAF